MKQRLWLFVVILFAFGTEGPPIVAEAISPSDGNLFEVAPAPSATVSRPTASQRPKRRMPAACSEDGRVCISGLNYIYDVCHALGTTAAQAGLDPHFFTRLIWRESLFDPNAISHAGALGIAQFMPATAALRGLDDPFNPAKALEASAYYLRELVDQYGNIGLAAGAYNAGEGRMNRYLKGQSGLPGETRAYISGITGHRAETWARGVPKGLDLRLSGGKAFLTACPEWVKARRATGAPSGAPWAMIYAVHENLQTAANRAEDMRQRYPSILGDSSPELHRRKMPGNGRLVYVARLETATRMAAARLCTRLRRAGGGCMVLKN
ncbi:MAG: lytic transglycosylase domain-containing protein [Pseudomonadota bacterium]